MSTATKAGIGAGVAALAAAAAGAGYYFYGHKNATKNRAKAAKWAKGLHADVMKEVKKAKKLDEKAYKAIVAEATKAYGTVKGIDKADLARAANELKSSWKHVAAEVERATKSGVKTVKKAAKKVAPKKAVKKVAKKAAKKKI